MVRISGPEEGFEFGQRFAEATPLALVHHGHMVVVIVVVVVMHVVVAVMHDHDFFSVSEAGKADGGETKDEESFHLIW